MPRKHREEGSPSPGSNGEMLHKKAATAASRGVVTMEMLQGLAGKTQEMLQKKAAASSGWAPTMDPGMGPSRSDCCGEMLQKKAAAAALSGGLPTMDPGKGPSGSDSRGEMLQKKAATAASSGWAPTMDPEMGPSRSDCSGEMLQKKAAAAALSGGARTMDPGKGLPGSDSSGKMLQTSAASSGGASMMDPQQGLSGSDSIGGMLQKKAAAAASSGGSAALGAPHGNSTAQDREEFDSKHRTKKPRTISSAKIPHEHCTEDEVNMGLGGGMLQKQSPKVGADTCVSGDMLHDHLAEEVDAAKGIKESDSNETLHAKERERVELLIEAMNNSGIGDRISSDEFLGYIDRIAPSPLIDLGDELEDAALDEQEARHALYRFRYLKYKFQHQTSKENMLDDELRSLLDKSEDDVKNQKFLEEEEFFRRFEKDWTLEWFIHPDYEDCSSLTDYQRLVLRNYGGTEYSRWSVYHKYLHSYKTEKEYLKYCEELSKKLKWMEHYACTSSPLQWDYITNRGAYQAIKIAATGFHEITTALAYTGYNECQESMAYDATWFKDYDGLYFEIWRLVTQKSISFKDALEEVCKLNKFPLRQRRIESALKNDNAMMWMETEYQTCTKAIASEGTDETARKLIAEAVQTLVDKPKSYEQYIRKKIEIARIIGILPPEDEEDSEE